MKTAIGVFSTIILMGVYCCSSNTFAQRTPDPETPSSSVADWKSVPTVKVEPREPPHDWTRQTDSEHGVQWFSPSEPKKTENSGKPRAVIYDAQHNGIVLSLCCTKTATRHQGSYNELLDAMDDAVVRSYRRKGLIASSHPVAHVEYMNTLGRLTRIDVKGDKTTLKCDLTTPTACYSVLAIGPRDQRLKEALLLFVTSIRVSEDQQAQPDN